MEIGEDAPPSECGSSPASHVSRAIPPRHAEYAALVVASTARVTANGQTRLAEIGAGVLTVTREGATLLCERFEWK